MKEFQNKQKKFKSHNQQANNQTKSQSIGSIDAWTIGNMRIMCTAKKLNGSTLLENDNM